MEKIEDTARLADALAQKKMPPGTTKKCHPPKLHHGMLHPSRPASPSQVRSRHWFTSSLRRIQLRRQWYHLEAAHVFLTLRNLNSNFIRSKQK
jgi:hypothetical protein